MKKIISFIITLILICSLSSCSDARINELEELFSTHEVLKANIAIIVETTTKEDIVTSTNYSLPNSGCIIGKEDSKYYALTAYHVISGCLSGDGIEILLYDEPVYQASVKKPICLYYSRKALIEKTSEEDDLALISFYAEVDLPVVELAIESISFDQYVVSIGNPVDKQRNFVSAGKILSKYLYDYSSEGMTTPNCFNHSCFLDHGSSGSMLLNESFKLVGINLGGSKNSNQMFLHGVAVDLASIKAFLA